MSGGKEESSKKSSAPLSLCVAVSARLVAKLLSDPGYNPIPALTAAPQNLEFGSINGHVWWRVVGFVR